MTLHLHRGTDTGALADGLAALVATPLPDPFAEEVVVVPAKGVERWLTQRLSHRLGSGARGSDGICAGVRFLNPRSLVALLTGTERDDPWDPDRLVWPLLDVVDAALDEPWCRTLAQHLGHGVDGDLGELRRDRRYSVVRRLAGLLTSYAVQRPSLLADWEAGRDGDGAGADLPGDLTWQAELWRRVVDEVPADSPVRRHVATVAAIRDGADLALPDRLSMFGHTRLPVTELELLRAVGEVREVHLWLPQASPAAWDRIASDSSAAIDSGPVRRTEDTAGRAVAHPLLSSLGRDSRELQRSLSLLGPVESEPVASPSVVEPVETLLSRLQADLRADHDPGHDSGHDANEDAGRAATVARAPDPDDRSVQVHACHGATRQVEVLREVLVGLMQDSADSDDPLEPRDILVMCPDVEAYAPLFSAAFGLGEAAGPEAHPAHRLRVRLADRGLMGTNPLLALAASLVTVAGGRGKASEVLDLAASPPVRHRFRLSDDDVATLTVWVEQSGVRWGLTEEQRAAYRLDGFDQNTWRAGLDRILLGVAMAESDGRNLAAVLPLDDVGSAQVALAGRLAELVSRLERRVDGLRRASTLESWLTELRDGVLDLASTPVAEQWQVAQFEREIDGLRDAATGRSPELRLADVRTLLEQRTEPRPTRSNFRTGHLTVSTLVPMRSVPHRVVCLVGLDDGVFPRSTVTDGDDVLARDPLTGERDPRSEDRQLLLDAVVSARETLVVTYTGANEHSGQPRPPAVPLGELLDAVDRTCPGAREHVVTEHPLQPFDARNFAGRSGQPASFDRAALAGAVATTRPRTPRPPLLTSPLPPLPAADDGSRDVALTDLKAFLVHPVRAFLRQRLDVGVARDHDELDDALPVEVDALRAWAVGDRVLRDVLAGADPQGVLLAEQLRGDLPPRELGRRQLTTITQRAGQLISSSHQAREAEARSYDVTVALGAGTPEARPGSGPATPRRLTGVVPDVRGHRIVRVHYSSLSPRHRLEAWVDLLALAGGLPDQSWRSDVYGWHGRTKRPQHALVPPPDHTATALLGQLVDLYDRGMREPLPLPLRSSHAWAEATHSHREADRALVGAWESSDSSPVPGEQDDAAHVRVFGRKRPGQLPVGAGTPRRDVEPGRERR